MKPRNELILILILIVGALLRFYNFNNIPFTHDEFSALFRLNFNDFTQIIEKGVKIDAHPAGVHVFLFYWTKLLGTTEWIVKLPFTILGLCSVLLIYLVAKKWFNETVGLISASFITTIQFTVIYSQIARPYISGLFFSLLMVYYWTLIIKNPNKNFNRNLILYALSSAMSAYNHHFSLLFAGIVGLSGLFFIKKEYLKKYILSGFLIFILYIPHLKIFFYQLNVGGIGGVDGWLGKPTNDFLIKYIFYIFNFSIFSLITTALLIIYGFKKNTLKNKNLKGYILFTTWFILPFLIGFYYSKIINPVLQFSVLIFSMPFLFLILFGHYKLQSTKMNLILVAIILITNIFSLVFEREHYKLFYHSVYEEILFDYNEAKKDSKNTLLVVDSHQKITEYFSKKNSLDTNFIKFQSFKCKIDFSNFLKENRHYKQLFFGCLSFNPPSTIPLIQQYFPKKIWQKNYVGGNSYLFSSQNSEQKINNLQNFEGEISPQWSNIDTEKISFSDSLFQRNSYYVEKGIEWGPKFSILLDDLSLSRNDFIDISVKIKYLAKSDASAVLVSTLESGNKNFHWSGTEFRSFVNINDVTTKWQTIHHSIKLSDIYLNYRNIKLNIYVWNKNKEQFLIDDFKIKPRTGNPIIYGLINKI